jgi:hypothetical protein
MAAFVPPSLVTAAIVPGVCDFPTEPTYTVVLTGLTSAGQAVNVPAAARYMDACVSQTTLVYGASAPILNVRAANSDDRGVPQLVRDYTTGVCIPPYPAPLGGFSCATTDAGTVPQVFVDTDVTCSVLLQFFLEL